MKALLTLCRPRLLSFRNSRISANARDHRARFYLFTLVGLLFWGGIFVVFYRILTYFQRVEGFGDVLSARLLLMVVMTFFTLLVFSSIIISLSKLYLSRDLALVHSLPVPAQTIFMARFIECVFDSSWMVLFYSLPIFLSYGLVYNSGPFFYIAAISAVTAMCVIASGISTLIVMVAAVLLPAGRIRTVFVIVGIALVLILVLAIRLMRPEQLVNPDQFMSVALYLQSLEAAGSPLLPTTWVYDAIHGSLRGASRDAFLNLGLAWSFAGSIVFMMTWVAGVLYFPGYSRAQTTSERLFPAVRPGRSWTALFRFLPSRIKAFLIKEIRTFFRDQTQWPQLFLIGALIVVYLYNFSVLPFDKAQVKAVYLQNLFSFLNMGLASFVLTAISARFVFPAVSMEGEAFWIVRTSPVSIRTFLWIKFFVYYFPLLILAEVLIVLSNILLHVTPFMMILSAGTVFCIVPGVVAMGVGLGAAYPDFHSENPAQTVTSFGGLLYMILCAGFIIGIIVLEAGPVYTIFMTEFRGESMSVLEWIWLVSSCLAVIIICSLAVVVPMRYGERRLQLP
ncbi:MAG: hypothetical protein PHN75_00110 [Syntrophales bacterium]|nr:hypothetical protein [Syntrophales bacterium]